MRADAASLLVQAPRDVRPVDDEQLLLVAARSEADPGHSLELAPDERARERVHEHRIDTFLVQDLQPLLERKAVVVVAVEEAQGGVEALADAVLRGERRVAGD